jgi:O-antigen ligase
MMATRIKKIMSGNADSQVITTLSIGIIYSLLFWTLLNSILCILLAGYWLLFSKKNFDFSSDKTKLMLLFISLYLIGVAGMTYTSNSEGGMAVLKIQSAVLIFPLVFGTTSVLNSGSVKKLTNHLLIATALACLSGLFYGLFNVIQTGETKLLTGKHILLFHAFRPVYMGLFCLLAMIIAFEKFSDVSAKWKPLLWSYEVLMSLEIFLLSIRLVIAFWLLIVFYFLWKNFQLWSHRLLISSGIIIILITTALTIPSLKKQWKELFDFSGKSSIVLDQDSSLTRSWGGRAVRVAIWQCSSDLLKKHWLTGVGTGDVQDSLQQAYENRKFYFASRHNRYNAHNQYLQITLANGLPGLLILLSCICWPLVQFRKKFTNEIYFLFLLLFAVICFSESLLSVNKGILWYSFFNSIFAFGYLKTKDQDE